ncbi:MAG: hypothetical protein R3236_07485 [Phycisphaeraceae bacterium]|nr:hypothetical protein [Phycisphaeraceae bacterium]
MKPNQTHWAGYALLASAFVLAGMLFVQIDRHHDLEPTAHAELVNTHQGTSILSARTDIGSEALWFLDPDNEAIIIYQIKPGRNLIEARAVMLLSETFARNREAGARRPR